MFTIIIANINKALALKATTLIKNKLLLKLKA